MGHPPQWPFVLIALGLIAFANFAIWYLGEWHLFAYAAGAGTGLMIAAIGMIADNYNKRSSVRQGPR